MEENPAVGPGTRRRKLTVEESIVLTVSDLREFLIDGAQGHITLATPRSGRLRARFAVTESAGLWLEVTCSPWPESHIESTVELVRRQIPWGYERSWFACPLAGSDRCLGLVHKLYLPPDAEDFGCRMCHGLTYQSCQTAHREARLFARLQGIGWLPT